MLSLKADNLFITKVVASIAAITLLVSTSLNAGNLASLKLPEGFSISIYAEVENPRQMALGTQGTVFVGSRGAGHVYAFKDTNKDGRADQRYLIDKGLNMPSGVAFYRGDLYVAAVNRILRYPDIEAQLAKPPKPELITDDLPDAEHHGWKAIEFNSKGELFVPVGVPCNICKPGDQRFGTILKMDVSSGEYTVYAKGVRNSVGLAFHPQDGSLWFTDNGRDWLGDDLPPDEINHAYRSGLDFGFPYLHGKQVLDPEYGKSAQIQQYTLPVVELGAHVAPLGLAFYTGDMFPEQYRNSVFVAEHGSWNRSRKSGYRVIEVQLKQNRLQAVKPFITGWLDKQKDSAWGRPVDIVQLEDGSMLVSDDYADLIYRVIYSPQ